MLLQLLQQLKLLHCHYLGYGVSVYNLISLTILFDYLVQVSHKLRIDLLPQCMISSNIYIFLQVCTGVMMHGYGLVKKLCEELKDFMKMHNFSSIEDFRGYVFSCKNLNYKSSKKRLFCFFYLIFFCFGYFPGLLWIILQLTPIW